MTATKTIPYSQEAQSVFDQAKAVAERHNQSTIDTECLLRVLIFNTRILPIISAFVSPQDLVSRIESSLSSRSKSPSGTVPTFASGVNTIRASIQNEAITAGSSVISPDHILLGILRHPNFAAGILLTFYGLDYQNAKAKIAALPAFVTAVTSSPSPAADSTKTSSKAVNAPATSCGSDCGCTTNTDSATVNPSQIPDRLKDILSAIQNKTNAASNIVGAVVDRAAYRAEWHKALDASLDLSENSGLSVTAAFVHVAMTHPTLMKVAARQQIRKEAIVDAIGTLLGIAK
mgnify:CR=1 FL=1